MVEVSRGHLNFLSRKAIGFALERISRTSHDGRWPTYQVLATQRMKTTVDTSRIGVLIQGPLSSHSQANDVAETIRLYRLLFPDSKLVLSTWDSSQKLVLAARFPREDVDVIYSNDPGPSMPSNVNRQRVSTHRGLMHFLSSTGITHALKTRVDQRFLSFSLPYKLCRLTREPKNASRIFVSSYGTGALRLYGATDQVQFGPIESMLRYWEPVERFADRSILTEHAAGVPKPIADLALHHAPELLLNASYLYEVGWPLLWTWENHLQSFAEYFGIINSGEAMLVQLGRKDNRIDHVTLETPEANLDLERHLSEDLFSAYLQSRGVWQPNAEELVAALKVPPSSLS